MRILLVNDDGYTAVGIVALGNALKKDHEVIMIAPASERSAFSHSVTFHQPISYERVDAPFEAYAVSGTPADCVKFGVIHLLRDRRPDIIVSGINNGPNLGSDIMYSGTVGAALEGAFMGIPAVAVSLSPWNSPAAMYDKAAAFVGRNLEKLVENMPADAILNINYPADISAPRGVKVTKIGFTCYNDRYNAVEGGYFIEGEPMPHARNDEDCDVVLCGEGYITVSPVTLNRNDFTAIDALKKVGFSCA